MNPLLKLDVPLVDVNVYLGRWPFRHLPDAEPADLAHKLAESGVSEAWVGSFDGLLERDLGAVNERLAEQCRSVSELKLLPFGSVNPTLPDWQEDLRRCHEVHNTPGIRLHPNYHGYKLDDPAFAQLLAAATERRLVVQLALSMEDERTQSPVFHVPHVDTAPLAALVKATPGLRLVVINGFRALVRLTDAEPLAQAGDVTFDISMLEGVEGISRLIKAVGLDRILFGSYYPFFYFESALLKLQESPQAHGELEAVAGGNA
jgi:predicted TIM-barrel fold metal-dependent hydrolase